MRQGFRCDPVHDLAASVCRYRWTGIARSKARCELFRYGTDCYAYALLAAGHIDLVIENSLKPYDVSIIPVIQEGWRIITTWDSGRPENGSSIIAAGSRAVYDAAVASAALNRWLLSFRQNEAQFCQIRTVFSIKVAFTYPYLSLVVFFTKTCLYCAIRCAHWANINQTGKSSLQILLMK